MIKNISSNIKNAANNKKEYSTVLAGTGANESDYLREFSFICVMKKIFYDRQGQAIR